MKKLADLIRASALVPTLCEITWEGKTEPAFTVEGMDITEALVLARMFQQEAILYNNQTLWLPKYGP